MSNTDPGFPRRRDLDVTRELIVASLILFHTASIFSEFNFYVKNETQEPAITLFIILASLWGIPVLFMIAGSAIWYSLGKRTWLAFLQERLSRLLVPFTTGLVIIVPAQLYYQLRSDAAYHESYMQFLPRFFDVTFRLFKGFVGWCWTISILGFMEHARQKREFAKNKQKSNINTYNRLFLDRVERYANEAVLPFYILHQTAIVIIAFYVVQWNTSVLLKFFTIAMAALTITLLLYEVVIKRTTATRFLFGMKSRTAYR